MRKRNRSKTTDPFQTIQRQKEITTKILQRDNYTCQLCGTHRHLQVHHIKFRSQGGNDVENNLLTLCQNCHGAVHRNRGTLSTISHAR